MVSGFYYAQRKPGRRVFDNSDNPRQSRLLRLGLYYRY